MGVGTLSSTLVERDEDVEPNGVLLRRLAGAGRGAGADLKERPDAELTPG
jgi:hypothetical protein